MLWAGVSRVEETILNHEQTGLAAVVERATEVAPIVARPGTSG